MLSLYLSFRNVAVRPSKILFVEASLQENSKCSISSMTRMSCIVSYELVGLRILGPSRASTEVEGAPSVGPNMLPDMLAFPFPGHFHLRHSINYFD